MKTQKTSYFTFTVSEPRNITTLEQVFCMVWLSQNCSLKQLRAKQDIIEQQIQSAHKRNLPTDNLLAMRENISAAVAYQSFPEDPVWVSFIRQNI